MQLFKRSWRAIKEAIGLLQQYKAVIFFPLLSFLVNLSIFIWLAQSIYKKVIASSIAEDSLPFMHWYYWLTLLVFALIFLIVNGYVRVALLLYIINELRGNKISVSEALWQALKRGPYGVGWCIVQQVGVLSSYFLPDVWRKLNPTHKNWQWVSLLALPISVLKRKNPMLALKQSMQLLESAKIVQLLETNRLSPAYLLFYLPLLPVLIVAGYCYSHRLIWISLVAVGAIYITVLSLLHIALRTLLQANIYTKICRELTEKD